MMTGLLAVGVNVGIFLVLSVWLLISEKLLVRYGKCVVTINDGALVMEKEGGVTLLTALYENKVFIPSACGGKATCGYCKVNVINGGGPVLPTEIPFLSRGEMRSGTRLACQIKLKENIEIALPEDLLAVKEYRAKVSLVRKLTHDMKEINLDLIEPKEIQHRPGKYIQIQAPGPDGAVFRAYSISTPDYVKDKVQLIIRLVPGGIASTYLHNLKEGDEVKFTGPYGEFRLSENPDTAVLCIGGGSGMAPIASIIDSIYNRWPERTCYLFFGCRTTGDVFYLDRFKKMAEKYPNFKVCYALSDPLKEDEDWDGDTGFIHLSVDKRLPKNLDLQTFLCGPPPMIEAVQEVLKNKGYNPEDAFYDKF
ncbi:MAG: 2Fe-2S iron-sulfur cluster binding domain-containing protein [Spirochaetes bacterium]|nr:2Fe-2S iron-sulfur cluster binding domain-containing protein [Spirochaetota bacterium]